MTQGAQGDRVDRSPLFRRPLRPSNYWGLWGASGAPGGVLATVGLTGAPLEGAHINPTMFAILYHTVVKYIYFAIF